LMTWWVFSLAKRCTRSHGVQLRIRNALSIKRRGRLVNREKKKNSKSKFRLGRDKSRSKGVGCWRCGEKRHIQRVCNQKNDGDDKGKEKDSAYITGVDTFERKKIPNSSPNGLNV